MAIWFFMFVCRAWFDLRPRRRGRGRRSTKSENISRSPVTSRTGFCGRPPHPTTDSGFWGWGTGSGRQGPTGPSTEWVGSCGPPRTRQVGASLADTAVLALAESKQPPTAATQRVHGSGPLKVAYFWKSGSPATASKEGREDRGSDPREPGNPGGNFRWQRAADACQILHGM